MRCQRPAAATSIALALRAGAPILAEESVLEEAGIVIPDEQEDEVEKFREFLDQISPEDFRGAASRPGRAAVDLRSRLRTRRRTTRQVVD